MPIEISTQIIHASFATVINKIQPNANIYDNPNQQGTTYPAWFIVHRSPVEVQKESGKRFNGNRYLITYQIDLWYMLKQNITRLFDQYTQIAEQLEYHLQYLPIFGSDAVVHVYDQSWSLELNALKYSVTLKLRVYTDENFVLTPMEVIEDLSIFLKNQRESIVSFTNTEHPEFDPVYPNSFSVTTGRSVNLPYVGGRFEDDNYFWTPSSWDVGAFGELIKVDGNITANLEWEYAQKTATITFLNPDHPEFQVELPDPITDYIGNDVTLPTVDATFPVGPKDWKTSGWDIGDFGDDYQLLEDTEAHLLWTDEDVYFTVNFTNTEKPEFDVELPEQRSVARGNGIILPEVEGTFYEGSYEWTPEAWNLGDFGDEITIEDNTSINLIWSSKEVTVYPQGQFIYGEMQLDPSIITQLNAISIDSVEGGLMESTGVQQSYGEFVPDAGLSFVMSQNDLMESTGIQQSYGEFMDDAGLSFVMSQNGLMEIWEPTTLPTVTINQGFVLYTAADTTTYTEIQPGASTLLYSSGGQFPYPSDVTFGVYGLNSAEQNLDKTKFEIYNDNGLTYLKNNSSSAAHIVAVYPAICESDEAEVVAVYDSQDNPFNAFKFNLDGVDYYYVLDLNQEDWTDDLNRIGYHLPAEYEDITLYLQSGTSNNMQFSATSATTTMSKSGYSSDVVYQLYTDSGRSVAFTPDLTKIYKQGYYNGTEWKELKYQSIDSMPETVTSNLSNSVSCYIILNSGMLWFLTNYNRTIVVPSEDVTVRVYSDNREWTTETLYDELGQHSLQRNCTCYTSPVPSSTSYVVQLYTDADRTTKFNYDLDREYRKVYDRDGSLVIAQIQSIWDMPTTTGSSASGFILLKTGQLWTIRNDNITSIYQGSTSIIQSSPKQYDVPTITLDLGLNGASVPAVTFGANDWWYAYLRNPLDKQKAQDFGLTFYIGSDNEAQLSNAVLNSFNIEILALCDAYENTVLTNMSNFSVGTRNNDRITINSVNAYTTPTNYWRVRITKKST